ncbi:hypothetical protein DM01DRAFT_1337973 [Hesseltinella vesiculosa]|uniref:PXA domain-containing protein n=1 Tax=Hesseltinella vesiculosa TaxID=101127 RepID=A0A1X2GBG3_9FUNG|nr:hypothetical protein DM01DRAFT_1337973 [Hesseltinella vesiculosa]
MATAFVFGALYFGRRHPPAVYMPSTLTTSVDEPLMDESDAQYTKLQLFYPPLSKKVAQLLGYFYRDFVGNWWDPLHSPYDDEVETLVKTRLNMAVSSLEKTLLNQERNDIVMATMYGLANTLIIHMRECRTLEDSQLAMDVYIEENPQSPFAQLLARKEQHQQLRGLSQSLLKRILPASDRQSKVLHSMFKELLASHLFGSVLNTCSDPDFINGWLVHYLQPTNAAQQQASADTDGIRSLVEKATEDAMAAEQEDALSSHPLSPTPSTQSVSLEEVQPKKTSIDLPSPTDSPASRKGSVRKASSSGPPTPPLQRPTLMIYPPGTVGFSIMDISAPYQDPHTTDPADLMFLIQIERPSFSRTSDQQHGSEGGGYVITRTYKDFDVFQSLLRFKHPRRVAKVVAKLPLEVTRTWLGKKTTAIQQQQQTDPFSTDAVVEESSLAQSLERYLIKVVRDPELGTEPLIQSFLRKERPTDQGSTQNEMSFADEYQDQVASYQQQQPKSFFSRPFSTSTSTSSANDVLSPISNNGSIAATRWLRAGSLGGSFSSVANSDTTNSDEDDLVQDDRSDLTGPAPTADEIDGDESHAEEEKAKIKSLSAMDTELLIETTYALIVEIFELGTTTTNKAWMRRSMLNLLREIVRRSYTEWVGKQYEHYIQAYLSPDALVAWMAMVQEKFWPDGKYNTNYTARTPEEKEQTKEQARLLLAQQAVPSGVRQLLGDQNTTLAMHRIWCRLQDENLNRVLVLQVMERVIKSIIAG